MTDITVRADAEPRMTAFARAYADPTSPTYDNGTQSYLAVAPDVEKETAARQAHRYMAHPFVLAEIQKIQEQTRALGALTPEAYITRALEREAMLANRGEKGDATAAAKYFELIGKAAGLLINVSRDDTPADRKGVLTQDSLKEVLRERLRRMDELDQPNPLPSPRATAKITDGVVDAEFDIVETNNDAG